MTARLRRRRLLVLIGASVPLVLATLIGPPAARAASVDDSGWWERNQGVTVGSPSRPPAGGLRVALDPAGVSAVAAVRYKLDADESRPFLTLRLTSGAASAVAAVKACPTTSLTWKGAAGGPIAEAPAVDCKTSVDGLFSGDRTELAFDATTLLRNGVLSIGFQPVATATDPVTASFVLDIAKPTARDLATTKAAPTTTSPADAGPSPTSPPLDSGPSDGGFTPEVTDAPSPVPTVEPSGFVPPEPTTAPPATVGQITPSFSPSNEVAQARPAVATPAKRSRVAAVLAVLGLIGLGGWIYLKEPEPATAGPSSGGLGKFVRERDADAPPVS